MAQSRPLSVGMDVHQASIAVADVAPAWGAAVVSLGTVGTRQGESAKRIRPLQSKSTQLVFVDAAGPCGSWLSRSLTTTGHGCWVVAPSLLPQKTGDRGTTARRDAMQGARLLRSGDRTPVSVPALQDAAMRDLSRARAATRHALKTATVRLTALLRRHAIRSTGRAPWGPAPLRWRREVVGPPPRPAPRLPSLWPGGHRPACPAPASGTGTPRAGHRLAALPGRGRVARPPWRAVSGGCHDRGGTRRPAPRRDPQTTHAGSRPAACGIFQWRAPTPGRHHADRAAPGPSCAAGRGLGLALPGQGQSAPATPPRKAPQADPGRAVDGPGPPVSTLSAAQRPGAPPAGRGRACPGAARVDGGHGPAGPCDRLETEAGWSLHRACQSVARDSAKVHGKRGSPGMGQPSTAFSGETSSCLDRGRHPTDTRKVGANPRRAA